MPNTVFQEKHFLELSIIKKSAKKIAKNELLSTSKYYGHKGFLKEFIIQLLKGNKNDLGWDA